MRTVSSLILLSWANIKRKKIGSALISITIALATLLFMTALGSLGGFDRPIENMLRKLNASHALVGFDARIYNPGEIKGWWEAHPDVASVTPLLPKVLTASRPVYQDRELGPLLKLTERPAQPLEQDRLEFLEGEPAAFPGHREIWISNSVARSAGIKLDSELELATAEGLIPYRVSAVVVDPHYSSGFMNPERAWIGPGELAFLFPPGKLHTYTLGIRVREISKLEAVWGEFNRHLGGGFSGSYLSHQAIVNSYAFMIRMLGIILLLFSFFSLVIALFIISATISATILESYRTFGILKAQGYTPRNIKHVYQLQFFLISIVSIPFGLAGSYFTIRIVMSLILRSIGTASSEVSFFVPALLTFVGLASLILLITGIAGGKAGRIKPATAIRYG